MSMVLSASALGRQVNGQVIMECIVRSGPISRAKVAKETGLSKQTVSELVYKLEACGWVRGVGYLRGGVGRTAMAYELNPDAGYVAMCDLGGTQLKLGIANVAGQLLEESRVPLKDGGASVVAEIVASIDALIAKLGIDSGKLFQVVVGVPGVVDQKQGRVHHAPNLPQLPCNTLQADLGKALRVPVVLENEVNLAAIGEAWRGCGQGVESLIHVALGTGIGMGVILDGKLWRGARGAAGEIGYMPVLEATQDPEVRRHGALESVASGQALLRQFNAGNDHKADMPQIFELAAAGNPHALQLIDQLAFGCAKAIAASAAVLDPALCVLGGTLGARPEIQQRVSHWLGQLMDEPLPLKPSQLGKQAGLVGALALALQEVHKRHFSPQHDFSQIAISPL